MNLKSLALSLPIVERLFPSTSSNLPRQKQSHPSDHKWEAEIRKFEEADQQNPPPKGAVLFIGSSSIRLWKDLAADFRSTNVINRGFGGSEIADSVYYADRIVIPYQSRMVVLCAGENDLANGKTPQQVFEDYKEFVDRIQPQLPNVRIAFISIKPSPIHGRLIQQVRQVNQMIEDYAPQGGELMYIDVFTPMLEEDGKPRSELFTDDRLHLNEKGYRLWKSVITPYIH